MKGEPMAEETDTDSHELETEMVGNDLHLTSGGGGAGGGGPRSTMVLHNVRQWADVFMGKSKGKNKLKNSEFDCGNGGIGIWSDDPRGGNTYKFLSVVCRQAYGGFVAFRRG